MIPRMRHMRKFFFKNYRSPEYITFFITKRCNCRCAHCFIKDNINQPEKELSLEEISMLSLSMPVFSFLSITGGEPFLRNDIDKIAKIFYDNNKIDRLNLLTNGYLTETIIKKVKSIKKICPGLKIYVKISIDGIGKYHDRIKRKQGIFKRAEKTIHGLKKIKGIRTGVIMTYSSENRGRMKEIFEYVSSNIRPDNISINWVRKTRVMPGDMKEYDSITNLISGYNKGLFYNAYKDAVYSVVGSSLRGKHVLDCTAGSMTAILSSEGKVYACEMKDDELGDLRKQGYDMMLILKSKKAEKIKSDIISKKCFCTHECNMLFNIMYSPKGILMFSKYYKKHLFRRLN